MKERQKVNKKEIQGEKVEGVDTQKVQNKKKLLHLPTVFGFKTFTDDKQFCILLHYFIYFFIMT